MTDSLDFMWCILSHEEPQESRKIHGEKKSTQTINKNQQDAPEKRNKTKRHFYTTQADVLMVINYSTVSTPWKVL